MIDAYATQPHYLTHLAPLLRGLEFRAGKVYVELNQNELRAHAERLGVEIAPGRPPGRDVDDDPVLIAGGADLQAGWQGRPVVYVEHGAGQSYADLPDVATYTGGIGRDMVSLFLCPRQAVCDLNRARYPNADAVAVGEPAVRPRLLRAHPTVVFTFHWDFRTNIPETAATWSYWLPAIEALVASEPGYSIAGHAHPKAMRDLAPVWSRLGILMDDYVDVASYGHVLVADNTSALYEFAALDRPVVVLDHPSYRRDVNHGLRFWSEADVGVRIGSPEELPYAIEAAFVDPPHVAAARHATVDRVYTAVGFEATRLAVTAILSRWP